MDRVSHGKKKCKVGGRALAGDGTLKVDDDFLTSSGVAFTILCFHMGEKAPKASWCPLRIKSGGGSLKFGSLVDQLSTQSTQSNLTTASGHLFLHIKL